MPHRGVVGGKQDRGVGACRDGEELGAVVEDVRLQLGILGVQLSDAGQSLAGLADGAWAWLAVGGQQREDDLSALLGLVNVQQQAEDAIGAVV